jgi:4-carboxymuconolactone decarboxylase
MPRRAPRTLHLMCVMPRVRCGVHHGVGRWLDRFLRKESVSAVSTDYTEVLRRLAINDEHFAEECSTGNRNDSVQLDPRTLALVRLGALVAVGGAAPSYGVETDAALSAGATTAEIVGVLVGIVSVVGVPCVVASAPSLALALGCDLEDALEQRPAR